MANDTWNPWAGCEKCSEGCANCYAIPAAAANARRGIAHYRGLTRKSRNGRVQWTGKVAEAPPHIFQKPLGLASGSVVFVNSMSDFFVEGATDDMRVRALEMMRQRADIAFLVLTKRHEEMLPFLARTGASLPDNMWVGVTVESSAHVDRIELLRRIPAAVRFLSIEPLLDDIAAAGLDLNGIDWVILGGESGKRARPVDPDWLRRVRGMCVTQNVALFFKQWGTWRSNPLARDGEGRLRKCRVVEQLDPHGTGGALLDGQLWREMPSVYWGRWAPLYRAKRHLPVVEPMRGVDTPTPIKRPQAEVPGSPCMTAGRPDGSAMLTRPRKASRTIR